MRFRIVTAACAVLFLTAPASAEGEALSDEIARLLECGHVYSLRSGEVTEAGDEDAALEFFHMGDALLAQARDAMAAAGLSPQEIEDADLNWAMMAGFTYAGEGEDMLAGCLAEWDSP